MLNFSDYLLTDEAPPKKIGSTKEGKLIYSFLRGPVPMDWLYAASALNGSALKVGILLWHISGLNKQDPTVIMRKKHCIKLDLSRHARYRALESLKKAGLISIAQSPGQLPSITILKSSL